ncbi:MAG: metallopeptidase family protein [Parvularculaceae bacterium]|nr:metallopeptidase family protein [Parvularculaceae bacterium]
MTEDWSNRTAPDIDEFRRLSLAAFDALPHEFRAVCGDLVIRVEEFADDAILDQMGIENGYELTGLYEGVDITRRSIDDIANGPDCVFLYRLPLLAEWAENGEISLGELVRHVLVHEIGHHFGLSDEDMSAIENSDIENPDNENSR